MAKAGVDIDVDISGLIRRLEVCQGEALLAAEKSVRAVTRNAEKALESATRAGTRGNLWRAWKSEVKTNQLVPAGLIYPNGGKLTRGAIASAVFGATIRGRRGQMVAIPLPDIRRRLQPRGRKAEALTPALFQRRTGKRLKVMPRRGKPSLLIVDRRYGPGESPEVAFILVPEVQQPGGRFSVTGTLSPFLGKLQADFVGRLRRARGFDDF